MTRVELINGITARLSKLSDNSLLKYLTQIHNEITEQKKTERTVEKPTQTQAGSAEFREGKQTRQNIFNGINELGGW